MREIKFRGKRTDSYNHEWVYGSYMDSYFSSRYGLVTAIFFNNYDICKTFRIPVFKNTLGQYTGLKDVNGKEIYEGDIVLINKEKNIKGIVKYSETYAEFVVVNTNNITDEYEPLADYKKHLEILGNEYENPELLEKEGI